MSNEQFSLCWDNFHKNMSSGMNSMLESEDLVDVTLAIEGQYLKAHKMILSVCSPYFRTLFSVNPCKHPIVFMKDISYVVMNDLLTFMYQGEVQVNQENLATFIKTAEALQIKGLTGDNNDVDDVVQETQTKRPAPTEEPKMRTIKKQCVQIPTKKTKLTPPTAETEIIVPPSITSTESKPELFVSVSNTNNDAVDFKMEPYDSMHDDEANDSNFDDGQTSEYIEEGIDGGKDYIMEGEEEPQAGTSGDGLADSQEARRTRGALRDSTRRLSGQLNQHQLVLISETNKRKRRRCRVCYANKLRKTTNLICKTCKVPLHLKDCFALYHLKKKY